MRILKPPPDSLHRFIALFGLIVCLFSLYKFTELKREQLVNLNKLSKVKKEYLWRVYDVVGVTEEFHLQFYAKEYDESIFSNAKNSISLLVQEDVEEYVDNEKNVVYVQYIRDMHKYYDFVRKDRDYLITDSDLLKNSREQREIINEAERLKTTSIQQEFLVLMDFKRFENILFFKQIFLSISLIMGLIFFFCGYYL